MDTFKNVKKWVVATVDKKRNQEVYFQRFDKDSKGRRVCWVTVDPSKAKNFATKTESYTFILENELDPANWYPHSYNLAQ